MTAADHLTPEDAPAALEAVRAFLTALAADDDEIVRDSLYGAAGPLYGPQPARGVLAALGITGTDAAHFAEHDNGLVDELVLTQTGVAVRFRAKSGPFTVLAYRVEGAWQLAVGPLRLTRGPRIRGDLTARVTVRANPAG